MIAAIVPQFFTTNLPSTLTYYNDLLGFETQFTFGEPTFYAGAIRDDHSLFFRLVPTAPPQNEHKYKEEYLDAYIRADDIDALYEEYQSKGVTFFRTIDSMPWGFREFVVKDCDDRLICFGKSTEYT